MSLLPVDEAVARVVAGVVPTKSETVAIDKAQGRTLAEPLAAKRTQPPFPSSAMDGYAVRAADAATAGARLMVIGMSAAGHRFHGNVGPGEAVRIFTGAPVPEGADSILIQENAGAAGETAVIVREPVLAGRHVRSVGLDFTTGEALLPAGKILGMRELALAAAMGFGEVPVRRPPTVAILATGDELVAPGSTPGPDQIIASNGLGTAAFARSLGAEPVDLGIVPDNAYAIGHVVSQARALSADILVTLGGASVGEHDLVRRALEEQGMALDFWKIAMRPGKPLLFGRLEGMRVLGLPGNPVSSLVCSLLFLGPLIDALLGRLVQDPTEPATLGGDLPANDSRQDYLRASLAGRPDALPVATALPRQDSSMLSTLTAANCLIVRAPGAGPAKTGETCRIIRLA